jgi:hypothetical protein
MTGLAWFVGRAELSFRQTPSLYNESAVSSCRIRCTGLSPHLAAAGGNLLRMSVLSGR